MNKAHLRNSDSIPVPHSKCSSYTPSCPAPLCPKLDKSIENTAVTKQIVLSLSSFAFIAFRGHLSVLIFVLHIVCVVVADADLLYLLCAFEPSFLGRLKAKDKQESERILMVMTCFNEDQEHFSVNLRCLGIHMRIPDSSRLQGEKHIPLYM